MEIILVEDVAGLGDIGETVNVKPGYARNFLIPRGVAIESASKNAKALAHKMKQLEVKRKLLKGAAQETAAALKNVRVELTLKVGGPGKVFGAIHNKDIAEALKALGYDIDRRRIVLPEPIKKVGVHSVKVKLHSDVLADLDIHVLAVAASDEDIEAGAKDLKDKMEKRKAKKEAKVSE